jgi:hypothetical protein
MEIVSTAVPEPTVEAPPGNDEPVAEALSHEDPSARDRAPPVPANDVAPEVAPLEPPRHVVLVKPILIGADGDTPVERKRGWWRR